MAAIFSGTEERRLGDGWPQAVLSRPWVQHEVREALELKKRVVLLLETDSRNGAVADASEYTAGAEDLPAAEALWAEVQAAAEAQVPWYTEQEFRGERRGFRADPVRLQCVYSAVAVLLIKCCASAAGRQRSRGGICGWRSTVQQGRAGCGHTGGCAAG